MKQRAKIGYVDTVRAREDVGERTRSEMGVVLDLLKVHPASLNYFIQRAERKLLEINDHLRGIGDDAAHCRRSLAAIFRLVHELKGEAAALGLEMFEQLAQRFETALASLRDKDVVTGEDLAALPLPLDEFLQGVALARDLMQRLMSYLDAQVSAAVPGGLVESLTALAQRIARDQSKQVQLITELDLFKTLPRRIQYELREIAVQLLGNAVVHGIEPSSERTQHRKPPAGSIYVTLKSMAPGEYEFVLRDDGRGLAPARIREALLRAGRYTPMQLEQYDDRQIVMKIFEAGFSTVASPGRDAGQGVGMDVVKQKIEQLGARLQIATREHLFTQFSIRFVV